MLRHPSSALSGWSLLQVTRGLRSAKGRVPGSFASTTIPRFETPPCGAASPMPLLSYMVSNMSSISRSSSSSGPSTGSAGRRRTSAPSVWMLSSAIGLLLLRRALGRHHLPDDARLLHHHRGGAGAQLHAVVAHAHDLPDQPAR